jgi:hypothetical protein
MDEKDNSTDDHPESPAIPPARTIQDTPAEQAATERQLQETEQKIEERMSAFERSIVRLTWAAVIISILSFLVFAGQLYEMISGGTQTDEIITAANGIKTAQDQLVLDNKQVLSDNRQALAEVLKENREELASALKQNRDALQTQTTASNGQLAAIQQQTEIGARPWLNISEVALAGGITINMKGEAQSAVHVVTQNIGKTPARAVSLMAELGAQGSEHQEVERLCTMGFVSTKQMGKYGQVLFPTDTLGKDETQNIGVTLKPMTLVERKPAGTGYSESLRLDKNGPPPSQEEIIFSMPSSVIGCVQYKSFTSETPYYTGFTYSLHPKLKDINAVVYNVRFDRRTGEATTTPTTTLKGNGSITIPFEWMGLAPNRGWGNDVVR